LAGILVLFGVAFDVAIVIAMLGHSIKKCSTWCLVCRQQEVLEGPRLAGTQLRWCKSMK
jgi:hypothetical protein